MLMKMSCNGCRILRKGCNENCILKQSLQGIDSPQAQANATVFVAKFFGRSGLMSFLSSVTQSQRPALFQSLLFEACGRTINPVGGAVGLLSTGNWDACKSAAETVLSGGVLQELDDNGLYASQYLKTRRVFDSDETRGLDLGLGTGFPEMVNRSPATPSEMSTLESGFECHQQNRQGNETKLLGLFF